VSVRAIDHVNIRAPADDIAKLKQFYCDVVGLREGWRPAFESRGHWLYAGDHPIVHLVEGDPDRARTSAGIDHVSFLSTDIDDFANRLREHGVEFRISQVPTLGLTQLLLRDPLGLGVEITSTREG
jgi:catechol 2,3-dioxygenase-like lactoylglutathione lyase family enzyme